MPRKYAFRDALTTVQIPFARLEAELPASLEYAPFRTYPFPKVEYISVIGIAASLRSGRVDPGVLREIITEESIYQLLYTFLIERYRFESWA